MKMKWIALLTALALLLCGVCGLAEGATLTVQGAGMVEIAADTASISLGVREMAVEVQDAQAAVNEKIAPVIDALVEAGVDRSQISTNAISIYPDYDYTDAGDEIAGYTASNNLLVTTSDIEGVGRIIDAAFAAGANNLDYVEFFAADTAQAGQDALVMAVGNARDKAEVIAGAAGKRVGAILEIREGASDEYSMPVMYARTEDAGKGTQVLPSTQRVTAAVSVVFELVDGE